jgi:uncharacterized membrane protein
MSNMEKLIFHYFNDDDFLHISGKIKEMEKTTSGEIRVAIKEKRTFFQRKKSLHQLAVEEFHKLKMNNTRHKTGILLYLLLHEKQFYILGDQGIHEKIGDETWAQVRDEIQAHFKDGNFPEGILWGIERVGKILAGHFPIKPDDIIELSSEVAIE